MSEKYQCTCPNGSYAIKHSTGCYEARIYELQAELAAANRVAAIGIGGAGKHAERVVELENEVSTLRESLAEVNRLLSLNVAEVARLQSCEVDARRYRWLRAQHWESSGLAVVRHPKQAVKLGHDCPSLNRLNELVDSFITASQPQPLNECPMCGGTSASGHQSDCMNRGTRWPHATLTARTRYTNAVTEINGDQLCTHCGLPPDVHLGLSMWCHSPLGGEPV